MIIPIDIIWKNWIELGVMISTIGAGIGTVVAIIQNYRKNRQQDADMVGMADILNNLADATQGHEAHLLAKIGEQSKLI